MLYFGFNSEGKTLPTILKNISWVDILFLILLLEMIYKGSRVGIGSQLISFTSLVITLFVCITYYGATANEYFGTWLDTAAKAVAFFVIAFSIFIVSKVVDRMISIRGAGELATLERVVGAGAAVLRAFLLFGLISIQLLLLPAESVRNLVVNKTKSCVYFVEFDTKIYLMMSKILRRPPEKEKKELINAYLVPLGRTYK